MCTPSFAAKGNSSGGGGNSVGLEFLSLAKMAITSLDTSKLETKINKQLLFSTIDNAKIIVTHEKLFVSQDGVTQECDAKNYPDTQTIVINEERWNDIKDGSRKIDLSVHEVLGLLKLEKTGSYLYSSGGYSKFSYEQLTLENVPAGTKVVFTQPLNFAAGKETIRSSNLIVYLIDVLKNQERVVDPRTCEFQFFKGENSAGVNIFNYALYLGNGDNKDDICEHMALKVTEVFNYNLDTINSVLNEKGIFLVFPSPTHL